MIKISYTVYLVEDEKNLNEVLTHYLKQEGWSVKSFTHGLEAKKYIDNIPDIWILDIMMPDIDGFELLKEIKAKNPEIPVIFISARNEDLDRIIGLEMGSDDYLPKPFLPRELVIRTAKILKRVYRKEVEDNNKELNIDPYRININNRTVLSGDTEIELTSKEFDLLMFFINHTGQALSREQILKMVWGDEYFGSDRVVDNLIKRLRKKMCDFKIETIYGYGYRRC